jgi:hypothetical protein
MHSVRVCSFLSDVFCLFCHCVLFQPHSHSGHYLFVTVIICSNLSWYLILQVMWCFIVGDCVLCAASLWKYVSQWIDHSFWTRISFPTQTSRLPREVVWCYSTVSVVPCGEKTKNIRTTPSFPISFVTITEVASGEHLNSYSYCMPFIAVYFGKGSMVVFPSYLLLACLCGWLLLVRCFVDFAPFIHECISHSYF